MFHRCHSNTYLSIILDHISIILVSRLDLVMISYRAHLDYYYFHFSVYFHFFSFDLFPFIIRPICTRILNIVCSQLA